MVSNFWQKLKKPIVGLAPMDGVTDSAFRFITDKYGLPDVIFTEFFPVEAIVRANKKFTDNLIYYKTKAPTVVQFFGSNPESFYQAAQFAQKLGYEGIDINMGCPDRNVVKKGGGAGLILQPLLVKKIISETKRGAGKLPVSVKTRIGYDKIITTEWISQLLETEIDVISLHGRTLNQISTGEANWEEIAKAGELAKKSKIIILGNGDVRTRDEAVEKCEKYKVDGVLIGRATWGNPWLFVNKIPTIEERFAVMVEQCEKYLEYYSNGNFLSMRKHLAWYCKGFDGAAQMRERLTEVNNIEEVKKIILTV